MRNVSGESIISYQYSEFGETSIYGDTDFYNEICYNGGIYDKNTGLYYLNARYYDPENGRFISRDSYRGNSSNPSTLHLYAYCANNPVNLSDPSGHIAISRIVGGIVGAVVGAAAGAKVAKSKNLTGWKKVTSKTKEVIAKKRTASKGPKIKNAKFNKNVSANEVMSSNPITDTSRLLETYSWKRKMESKMG